MTAISKPRPGTEPGPTRRLASFAAELRYAALADKERQAVRRHVLDTLGACLAGSAQEVTRIACDVFRASGLAGDAKAAGLSQSFDMLSAIYVMGTATHGLELDDGYRAGSVHPGAVVLPAALGIGAAKGCDGQRFMAAIAAGYETSARLAEAIHPQSRVRGFHNTSVVGPLAAAVAAGVICGHDADTIEQALGLAASSAGGLFAFLHGGGEVKRVHAGHAAREGALAALLAERGLTGPVGVLEGKDGLFQAFSSPEQAETRFRLSTRPELLAVTNCYMKPYACCRHLHPAIDGVLQIMSEEHLAPEAVRAVEIGTYAIASEHAGTGWEDMASAQMSFPFCIGLALHGSPFDIADFHGEARRDRRVIDATKKVKIATDAECDRNYPAARSAKVRVLLASGQAFDRFVSEPYGSPKSPLDDGALRAKFRRLATPIIGSGRADAVIETVENLDGLTQVRDLMDLMVPERT